jgi:hypothetical protein
LARRKTAPARRRHPREIDRGIRLWDKLLLCCSKDSLTSWWVDHEIGKAFAKEEALMKERRKKVLALIPLDLDGYLFKGWDNGKASQVKDDWRPSSPQRVADCLLGTQSGVR